MERLHTIFNPTSIAIVGASERQESVGYAVLNNLLTMGYEGGIFPINPKREKVLGAPAYPSLRDINAKVDMVVIATPAPTVPDIVRECGALGIRSVVIISSGFAEIGEEGKRLEAEIEQARQEFGIRIIGPNCLGVMNPWIGMNASFAGKMPFQGKVGFISQSGALCTSILDWSIAHHIGFSNFVSIGSMLDVEFSDLIDYFDQDGKTESIILYIESVKRPKEFLEAARKFTRNKPIFAIKAGRFEEGSKAAASHTGALAGSDGVYDAALDRAGIVRVKHIEDLINISQSLSMQKIPEGNRLCILTNAGGPGVITTDATVERGGRLAELSSDTMKSLDESLPAFWSHNNPVDVLGDAQAERYEQALDLCLQDQNSDAVMVIFTPQAMSEPVPTARAVARLARKYAKPVFTSWMGAEYVEEGVKHLLRNGVPSYSSPEPAIDAFSLLHRYGSLTKELADAEAVGFRSSSPISEERKDYYRSMFESIKAAGERDFLNEVEAKALLEEYGIPTSRTQLATEPLEAAELAAKIGYPVVAKIQSPDILHKSDAGGVALDLASDEEVRQAFEQICHNARAYKPDARIEGVTVQKMIDVKGGTELLLGMNRDPLWGPTVIFGAGGVNVEFFRDSSISLLPLNEELALRAISKTKISELLAGYRGSQPVDMRGLARAMVGFAQLAEDFEEIAEVDINPLSAKGSDIYGLDARIILR